MHSHENQVIFMWSILHEHSIRKRSKQQLGSGRNVCIWAKWPIRPALIPVSVSWSDSEYFYQPLDRMLVHHRITPNIKFTSTYWYNWVMRGFFKVKCHNTMYSVKCHNTMFTARSQTQTARNREKLKRQITGCLHRLLNNFKMNILFL